MYKEINLAISHTGRSEQPLKSHINLCVCTLQVLRRSRKDLGAVR